MTTTTPLTKKDFKSDQEIRWCPGCGDYAILNAVQSAFARLGKTRHDTVIVSGIGCSSRLPYYMETYGFHTIHGRAPAIATGVKVANPALDVWVVTGDGDALSIGGNHFIHALRRNVGLKILLFNNRIYGLTKGQYSPTSEQGKVTKSTPMGSVDYPFSPISLALGAGATMVARSVDIFGEHLEATILRASAHQGTAIVEIYQNCNIFNDHAYEHFSEKSVRAERTVQLEHGKPLLFGANKDKGLAIGADMLPRIVTGAALGEALVWDEKASNPAAAMALATMSERDFPVPIGVFKSLVKPSFEQGVRAQIEKAACSAQERGVNESLDELLLAGEVWKV
jgi:2-oxoglutarate ferredoxin oxidoreductase subunit beta